jgi:saccharopine dehydrogenase (NAD+, L-lysine-forming)
MKKRIGIRREDKNPWERRVPLIPSHVRELLQNSSLELWMQPSTIRIFPDEDYVREGAKIDEDLSSCSLVFAVKEIPEKFFQSGKTYVFFSHTIKGQPCNMPMLKKMMELKCNLIDYERIVDEKGQRLLFFGTQAGQAGMIDSLWALGQRIHYEEQNSPFFELMLAHQYSSLVEAKEHIQKVGWKIHDQGLDQDLVPLICGFAGYGHVSIGAQQIFELLPFEEISPEELYVFYESGNYASNRVYKVVFKEEHMVRSIASSHSFELQDYYDHPEKYQSILDTYLPYLTVLMNCIYWAPQYPHFVTKQFLRNHWQGQKSPHLKLIGDISCDVEGAIECTVRPTDPGNPVYVYDPIEEKAVDGIEGRGVVVMATDNLPAELPLESSIYFSDALEPLVPDMARADFSRSFEDCSLPQPVKKAVILYQGDFTPDYKYMKKFLE